MDIVDEKRVGMERLRMRRGMMRCGRGGKGGRRGICFFVKGCLLEWLIGRVNGGLGQQGENGCVGAKSV